MSETNVSLAVAGISAQQARELIATGKLNHPLADFIRPISWSEADELIQSECAGFSLVYFRDETGHDLIGHIERLQNGENRVTVTKAAQPHPEFLKLLGMGLH